VRYSSDSNIDAGNATKPTFAGAQIMAHPDCFAKDFYCGVISHIFPVASRKPFWQNSVTGGNILQWVQGTAGYGAKLGYHFNIGCDRRNVFTRLGGLT
jgi:hypothetical protein